MSGASYGSPLTAMREALCDPFGLEYGREYGCGSPGNPCSCVPLANAIDQAEREVAELREAATEAHAALGKALHATLDRRSVHHAYVRLGDALNPQSAQEHAPETPLNRSGGFK